MDINLKNKKNLPLMFFVAAIVFASVLLGAWFFIRYQDKLSISPADVSVEKKKADEATMEKTASLVSAKDPAQCDLVDRIVNGVNYKTVCLNNIYYNMSADNLDYSACEKLVDMSVDDCQRRVMLLSISKGQNLDVCDKAPEKLKLSCPDEYWNFMATSKKDPSLCAKTSSNEINSNCQSGVLFSMVSRDAHIVCSSFSDSAAKADCENYLKGNENCALIKNGLLKETCIQKK